MADKNKEKTIVKEGSEIPTFRGEMYWEEPSIPKKIGIVASDAANSVYDAMREISGAKRVSGEQYIKDNPVKKAKGGKVAGKLATRGYGISR